MMKEYRNGQKKEQEVYKPVDRMRHMRYDC